MQNIIIINSKRIKQKFSNTASIIEAMGIGNFDIRFRS